MENFKETKNLWPKIHLDPCELIRSLINERRRRILKAFKEWITPLEPRKGGQPGATANTRTQVGLTPLETSINRPWLQGSLLYWFLQLYRLPSKTFPTFVGSPEVSDGPQKATSLWLEPLLRPGPWRFLHKDFCFHLKLINFKSFNFMSV